MGVVFGGLRKVLKMDHRRGGVEGGNLEPADSETATRPTIDYEMAMGDDDDIEMLAVRRRPRCQTAADVLDNWNKKYDEVIVLY